MGSEHPKFKKGQRSISAEQMNAVSRDAEIAGKTKVKGGTQNKIPGVGQIIDTTLPSKRDAQTWDTSRTVVIKKSPSVNAGYVTVQSVRYSTWPIVPCNDSGCNIVAYGPEFEVRPEYGQKTDSYAGFEVGTEPITTGTTFFRVRRENDAWILNVQGGGGGVAHCVVREVFGEGSIIVHVQLIGEEGGRWVVQGGIVEALAKPGRLSVHYAAWVWQGAIHQTQTRFLPLYYTGGKPRLGFELDMAPQFLPASARVTDCRPFTRATGI